MMPLANAGAKFFWYQASSIAKLHQHSGEIFIKPHMPVQFKELLSTSSKQQG